MFTKLLGKRSRAYHLLVLLSLAAGCRQPAPPPAPAAGLLEGLDAGGTRIVDLTHALNARSPHWPGPGYEPFKYEIFATIEKDGVLSGRFATTEHAGTHLDAPNHFVAGQAAVDQIPLKQLVARAVVVDVRSRVASDPDYQLSKEDVAAWEQTHGRVPSNALILMFTGWDARWNDFAKYKNADAAGGLHFPGFAPELAEFLVSERDIAGLGVDTLSVDHGPSKDFRVHHVTHGKGKYHLENVANLGQLPAAGATVVVAPIKIENGTGGPARVLAFVRSDAR